MERAAKNAVAISLFLCCNNPCSKRSAIENILIIAAYSNPIKKSSKRSRKNPMAFAVFGICLMYMFEKAGWLGTVSF